MNKKIIRISDFKDVARNNEYFLWHFLQKNQEKSNLGFYSYFNERENDNHQLKEVIDLLQIPYFESYVEDSIDFLNGLGIPFDKLWSPIFSEHIIPDEQKFSPIIIGFKKFVSVSNTSQKCYCVEGLINVVDDLNPNILLSINTKD